MGLTHADLVEVGRKWLSRPWKSLANYGHSACSLILTEMTSSASETPDVLGFHWHSSILIECKASKEDFKKDAQKYFRRNPEMGVGIQRYYMAPVGVLSLDEIPEGWGLVEVGPDKKTRVKRASGTFAVDNRSEIAILLSLLRRLKVDPGPHVHISAYTIENSKKPRATVTFVEDSGDEKGAADET